MTLTRSRATVAVLIAALLFGTSATARQLADVQVSAPAIAALRLAVGAVGLMVVALMRTRAQVLALLRRPAIWIMGAAVAGYQAFFFAGTDRTGVAIGTLVSLALAPFAAGLLAWRLGAGRPSATWAVSTAIAVLGVGLLTGTGDVRDGLGIAAALGAGASYAVYTVLGARLIQAGAHSHAVLAVAFALGAVMASPWLLDQAEAMTEPRVWLLGLWLGLMATSVAYLLFGIGLRVLPAGTVASLNLAEPVMATLLGVAVLGESLGFWAAVGCAIIMVGLVVVARDRGEAP